jgi:hypothetical protein
MQTNREVTGKCPAQCLSRLRRSHRSCLQILSRQHQFRRLLVLSRALRPEALAARLNLLARWAARLLAAQELQAALLALSQSYRFRAR